MIYLLLMSLFSFSLDLMAILGIAMSDKDLEIILLRQQIRILQRKVKTPPRISDPERMVLAFLADRYIQFKGVAQSHLHQVMFIFKPDTVLRWHRVLVRRKWTFKRKDKPGRPGISSELETMILRLAKENPHWGYDKIQGELLKLGHNLSASSVRNILKRHKVAPSFERSVGSWRNFLGHYKDQILACDFFTVETVWLKTIYVLFFIELGTRRIHLAGCTRNPNQIWVSQQARQLVWVLNDQAPSKQAFLIHDHDSKFTSSFDVAFSTEGIKVIHTPFQAPRANAYAERWVRSAREECLDHLLILNENHLRRVLKEYVTYYNTDRPHQGIHQLFPISGPQRHTEGPIRRRDILGGIIHNYYRQPSVQVPRTG
jgi:putative transposase